MTDDLPQTVCFRVTRYCNARCGFCLAPPDGAHPSAEVLRQRIAWLLARGVRTLHFCGGEPTLHPALPQLIAQVVGEGARTELTTNGMTMPADLIPQLRAARTPVKVSVHGPREHHNALVGREAFDRTTGTLRRLLDAGVPASVQTTLVAGGEGVLDWMVAYCLESGVRRLSLLPFIPRGSGQLRRGAYELTDAQRRALQQRVREKRRAVSGRLDLRWLDFTARPVLVAEADGTLVLEGATESMDRVLCRIPAG